MQYHECNMTNARRAGMYLASINDGEQIRPVVVSPDGWLIAAEDLGAFFELWRTKSITAWGDWLPEVDRAAERIQKIISAPAQTYSEARSRAAACPSTACASVRAMTTKFASVRASTAALMRSTISLALTSALPGL